MLDTVKRTISDYTMLATGENVLVALSGGADSVALLLSLRELGYPVRAFHLNHCLRGAESDRDEAFCRRLCDRLGVELTVERVDVAAAAGDSAVEETARRIRYARLEHAAHGVKIAVAHNADDNLETMLFHLVRGTGAKGLTGIPPVRGRIIRPLIEIERREIEAFLRERGQDFVTDSTNADTAYTRNRLRQEVVPILRELNPQAVQAAARLSRQLRQDETCLQSYAQTCVQLCAAGNGAWKIQPLREAASAVRSRALRLPLKDVTAKHISALEHLLETASPSAETDLPNGCFARREYDVLRIIPKAETAVERPEIPFTVPFAGMIWKDTVRLTAKKLEKSEVFYKTFNTFCLDCGTIDFESLCVRTRRTGDTLRLTENGGSRSLKKLMIDRKIPRYMRNAMAVIADKNGVIAVQDIGADCSRTAKNNANTLQITVKGLSKNGL
jgi:tRNA(Ile)-lysidine synthetase-like protein